MIFQKKLIVAAVAGALGAGATGVAFAQTTVGNTEIYGRLYPEFTVGRSSGATPAGVSSSTLGRAPTGLDFKSRNSVDASNSRLGFRGTENLGGGLSALWQIETQVAIDQGVGTLASRDSFVGLKGGFGTVKLGNMETVYKYLGDPLGILGISSGNFVSLSNVISSRVAFGTSSAGSFHLRRNNSVIYQTPELGGFTIHAQYSPDEIRSGNNLNADLWSVGLEYKRGPIEASIAHEIHNDLFAGSNGAAAVANPTTGATGVHSKDKGTRGTVGYTYSPGGKLQVNYATVEFNESGGAAGRFQDYSNDRWSLTWEHRWNTQWRTAVGYANASSGSCSLAGGVACTTNGLGAKMLTLGADYSFSRRTALFFLYAKLNNNSASQQRNAENWTPEPGTDITQYAIGIRHNY